MATVHGSSVSLVSPQFVELHASAARTETGTASDAYTIPVNVAGGISFQLNLTAAATDVGDTLNVYVQTTLDGGSTWTDVVAFTQCLGNGGAKRHVAKIGAEAATTMFENAAALAAGSIRSIIGDAWRVRWDITDGDADASFTFSVTARPC